MNENYYIVLLSSTTIIYLHDYFTSKLSKNNISYFDIHVSNFWMIIKEVELFHIHLIDDMCEEKNNSRTAILTAL